MIEKAVVPAAGLGTRLLPATKEQPKEMLPVFARGPNGVTCLKPILQLIFEQLYDLGLREFHIITGRGKRAIEDHFTQDRPYADHLRNVSRVSAAEELEAFYRRLDDSVISWVTQPEPRGFGDAVLRARKALRDKDFMVHAGDAYIISKDNACFRRLTAIFSQKQPSAVLLIQESADLRQKGVAEVRPLRADAYEVLSVAEKPERPKSKFGIEPVYIFQPHYLEVLDRTKPGKAGEIEVTDAIQLMINEGGRVHATRLLEGEKRLDVGNPDSYWETLSSSYMLARS